MEKVITHVGLDVHSKSIVYAVLVGGAREVELREIPNDPKVIRRTFRRLASEAYELKCCYEAGPCGFEVYRQLSAMGIACEVIAPALIPVKAADRVKTDRRDASKLARLYRAGELTTITVPTADQEAVRDMVRAREDVRKDLAAARTGSPSSSSATAASSAPAPTGRSDTSSGCASRPSNTSASGSHSSTTSCR